MPVSVALYTCRNISIRRGNLYFRVFSILYSCTYAAICLSPRPLFLDPFYFPFRLEVLLKSLLYPYYVRNDDLYLNVGVQKARNGLFCIPYIEWIRSA